MPWTPTDLPAQRNGLHLLAEAGGSRTRWAAVAGGQVVARGQGVGLSPQGWGAAAWRRAVLQQAAGWQRLGPVGRVSLYGAGLDDPHLATQLHHWLQASLPQAAIAVAHDLPAVGTAWLPGQPGLVGIVGTGSVAGRWSGQAIVQQAGGLGHLVGDPGSGFDLGRRLLQALDAGHLPPTLHQAFADHYGQPAQRWAAAVYARPKPVAEVAGLARWVVRHRQHTAMRRLIAASVEAFWQTAIHPLAPSNTEPLVLVGGLARPTLAWHRQQAAKLHMATPQAHADAFTGLVLRACQGGL